MDDTLNNPQPESRLKYFPMSWFSVIMGMCGLAIAWNRAEHFFTSGFCISSLILGLTTLTFLILLVLFTIKIARYPEEVLSELKHPVKHAFAPTFSISFLLLSIAYLQINPDFSFWMWCIGSVIQLVLTFYVLSSWIHHDRYEILHLNPAWFIPVVGNLIIPIAGVTHAHGFSLVLDYSSGQF
jgi:tellurite resistance protein